VVVRGDVRRRGERRGERRERRRERRRGEERVRVGEERENIEWDVLDYVKL